MVEFSGGGSAINGATLSSWRLPSESGKINEIVILTSGGSASLHHCIVSKVKAICPIGKKGCSSRDINFS